jgi:hypothetical protein
MIVDAMSMIFRRGFVIFAKAWPTQMIFITTNIGNAILLKFYKHYSNSCWLKLAYKNYLQLVTVGYLLKHTRVSTIAPCSL